MRHDEYARHDGLGLAGLIRDGEVTATEVLKAAIARRNAVNPVLNAVVESWDEQAMADAEGLEGVFGGVPFLIKDMDGRLAGRRCTYSSRALADWVPERTSELFVRFQNAGLNIFGKTNCPEFGSLGFTEPELRGPARNPWNLAHTPGGSSGGSAAAVAAGIVPMAHGGDGAGSLRIPASHCGIFGLKPSRGLVPMGPEEGEDWDGLVSRLLMSRSVRDSATALDVVRGADPGAPYAAPPGPQSYRVAAAAETPRLRVAFSTRALFGTSMHADAIEAVDQAAALLESLGHEVFEYDLPIDPREGSKAFLTILAATIGREVAWTGEVTGRKPDPHNFERSTWFLKQVGDAISAAELSTARAWGAVKGREFGELFGPQFDVHLTATVATPPVRVGALALSPAKQMALSVLQRVDSGAILRKALDALAMEQIAATPQTEIYNMTGQPAASVPMHITRDGLPVGVQIAAAFGNDALLLQLATQIEAARPWAHRLPTRGAL